MGKLQLLTELRKYVEEGQNIKKRLVERNENGDVRFCSIGFLLNKMGMTIDELEVFDSNPLGQQAAKQRLKVQELMKEYNFTEGEFGNLQGPNDYEEKHVLLAEIDRAIKTEKEKVPSYVGQKMDFIVFPKEKKQPWINKVKIWIKEKVLV